MCVFGLGVGLTFPLFSLLLGVERETALRWPFVLGCVVAGSIVGVIGTMVIRREIGRPLQDMAASMQRVRDRLTVADRSGTDGFDAAHCQVDLVSDDAIGACAESFNELLEALARTRELDDRVRAVSVELSEHLEPERIATTALRHLVVEGPFDAGAVLVARRDEIEVAAVTSIGDPESLVDHPMVVDAVQFGRGRRTTWPEGLSMDVALVSFAPRLVQTRVLSAHGAAFGVLLLAAAGEVDERADRLADVATAALSLSMRNAITHAEVEQLAAIDALTGLYNRRLGMQRLEEEYARAVRARGPLAVLLFDIDHFKQVNDTHGHLAGDRILRSVSDAAARVLREGDALVRLGGEEFLAIAPGASLEDAVEIAHRIRNACSSVAVQIGAVSISITVSVGVATYPDTTVGAAAELIVKADEAMYAAKRSGRDRVVTSTVSPPVTLTAV